MNGAAELLFQCSARLLMGEPLNRLFMGSSDVMAFINGTRDGQFSSRRVEMAVATAGRPEPIDLLFTATIAESTDELILEVLETDTRMRAAREERMQELAHENRQVLRNLAHEVKNPLGGIRGAAQLLNADMPAAEQRECVDVIVNEVDRLQSLVDRLLEPHRQPHEPGLVNPHEICEHVCRLVSAEYPSTLEIVRDYDISLPEINVDREQLIQVMLNLLRNAAQALQGSGRIDIVTRAARQVNISRKRCKLALELHVVDNGPGIDSAIRDRVFLPLVTGRADGTGLGLTLVQSFVHQNGGAISLDSQAGRTDFQLLFPFPES
jgi:two-component system nitrogen regulation sensor histidine kinase GlnL